MKLGIILNVFSAIAAIIAAILWFWSAKIKIPSNFPITVMSVHSVGAQIIGEQIASSGSSEEIDDLARAMIKQSKLSGYAAIAAGIAASLQAAAAYFAWQ